MRYIVAGLIMAGVLCATGCVVSTLQPFYTKDTLTFDKALLGTWQNKEGDTTYTVTDDGAGGYGLVIHGKDGARTAFSAHLVQLEGKVFLDLFPNPDLLGWPGLNSDYAPWNYAPMHNVFLVDQIRPTFQFQQLSTEWLAAILEADPLAVSHGHIDTGEENSLPVLTGSTAELQAFYRKSVDTKDAYVFAGELLPVEPAPAESAPQ